MNDPDVPDATVTVLVVDAAGGEVVVATVDGSAPDLVLVDAVARIALLARRRGATVRLRGAAEPLGALLAFLGLAGVVGCSAVEPRREAELGEQRGGDEVVEPGDPPV